MRVSLAPRLFVVTLFAGAMGWLEAVVVVYLRALLGFEHGAWVLQMPEVMARLRSIPWLMPTEQGREMATILMLVAVGMLAASTWRGRFGAFLVTFGVWDIVYYVGLRAMLGWPRSLGDMDVLFLIPPSPLWHQPVWVPVAISCGMIAAGVALMRADFPDSPRSSRNAAAGEPPARARGAWEP